MSREKPTKKPTKKAAKRTTRAPAGTLGPLSKPKSEKSPLKRRRKSRTSSAKRRTLSGRNGGRDGDKRDNHNSNRPLTGEVGRPAYVPTEEDIAYAGELAGTGLSREKIARALGISKTTFYEHLDAFRDAIEEGEAIVESDISMELVRQARKGSIRHIKWWESTRKGRRANGAPTAARTPDEGNGGRAHTGPLIVIGIYKPDGA